MNTKDELRAWVQKHALNAHAPAPWQNRKIGPEWECDFTLIEPKILHIHFRFPKEATYTQWKRFFQERVTFLEEHGPSRPGWCEVWSRDGSLPPFTLDTRSLFLDFLNKSKGRLQRWFAVKTSRLFKAQREIWEKTPIILRFPNSLEAGLESALEVIKASERQLVIAKGHELLFKTETCNVFVGDLGKSPRWLNIRGVLHADALKDIFSWLEDYFHKHDEIPHLWNDYPMGFSSPLTQNAYLKLLGDFTKIHTNIEMVRNAYLSNKLNLGGYNYYSREEELENTNELLRKDIEFLKKKNDTLEVTLQKETLKGREAMAAKADFLNVINHELKTPLNGISGMIELLKSTELSEDQTSFLSVAEQSSLRLLDLVNNLLEFSKIDSGELEIQRQPFEVNHLFKALLESKENREDRRVSYHFQGLSEPINLFGDIQRLQQVASELISNARKNTDEGRVSLCVSAVERNESHISLKVEVVDTGVGIPKEKVAQLFNDFTQVDMSTTRRISGSGLGLSLCRKILGMMGGKMGLSSEVGMGSRFWFTLPLEIQKFEQTENDISSNGLDAWDKRHALVVEDNAITRRVLVKELQKLGLHVDVTGNGFAAIDLLLDQNFDLVLVDLMMPECDGFKIAKEILKNPNDGCKPVFMGVAREFSADINSKCMEAGMVDCLSKPINPEKLSEALSSNLPPNHSSKS